MMTHSRFATLSLAIFLSLSLGLAACGGGGSGWVAIPASGTPAATPAPETGGVPETPAAPTPPPSEPPATEPAAPETHTIGGTVTGLGENRKLVLLNNGGDALTLTGDGPFRFSSAVPPGSGYAVTLATQPLWQACRVSNGSGSATADVADVAVTCADAPAQVSTLPGSAAASFAGPWGVATDRDGNVYVADSGNRLIRKILPSGAVTTLAGSGSAGSADGQGIAASFMFPAGITIDQQGTLYVADAGNNSIRKITPTGQVTTLAGSPAPGAADGIGVAASFDSPYAVTVDANGNVYVADFNNNRIRKITPTGVVTTLAGSQSGSADGTGTAALFSQPAGLALDANGQLYVSDYGNNTIRKITPEGVVTTLAGSGLRNTVNGSGTAASFLEPAGVAVDASGTVFVSEYSGHVIRKITPAGDVTTFAGAATSGATDGIGEAASFFSPYGLAVDADGQLFVADSGNNVIRKIASVR